ncbi:hypothetical protein QR680_007903 [Steinernema hermaphroditum]|uniref:Uncharacterized protein n=1 Tax=Steinernema hermaphroditum TaxID=289476 RepID=A0AA39M6V8_9BILA|nr:hypothetical protein QR680_007903 [Steinernema hermaphroditum]
MNSFSVASLYIAVRVTPDCDLITLSLSPRVTMGFMLIFHHISDVVLTNIFEQFLSITYENLSVLNTLKAPIGYGRADQEKKKRCDA